MTMHLMGPAYNTSNTRKRKAKQKTAKMIKAEAEHEAYLKKLGVGKTKLPVNKKGERVGLNDIPDYKTQSTAKLGNNIAGHGAAREPNVYSGERQLLGIATMHKSNMVPVFADKKEDAKDIAGMRR